MIPLSVAGSVFEPSPVASPPAGHVEPGLKIKAHSAPLICFPSHSGQYPIPPVTEFTRTTVGFVWLFFVRDDAAEEEITIREPHRLDILLLVALLCFLISADNLLIRMEGHHETVSFWLRSGRGELIFVFGLLSAVCQLLFWSGIVRP